MALPVCGQRPVSAAAKGAVLLLRDREAPKSARAPRVVRLPDPKVAEERPAPKPKGAWEAEALPARAAPAAKSRARIGARYREDTSWGRDFGRFIGDGFLPPFLLEELQGKDLLDQLFLLRHAMQCRIRYEKGRETIKRPSENRGLNKPVTYASNIWNRGYANCAGHCVVFASALRALQVPYCVVSLTSKLPKKPKHAIMQVGFPEHADIKKLSRRAYELWAQFYGRSVKDPKEKGREARLFTGLKFTRSREGSAAALHKGCGRWLVLDPGAKVGCYQHLIENGYMTQSNKSFWFAAQPQIKNWLPFAGVEPDAGTPDMPHSDSDSDASSEFEFQGAR